MIVAIKTEFPVFELGYSFSCKGVLWVKVMSIDVFQCGLRADFILSPPMVLRCV